MKKVLFLLTLTVSFLSVNIGNATLHDRGGGLIYDDVLNITWLQDANYAMTTGYDSDGLMTRDVANLWAANLSYYDSVRGVYYNDWRLPHTLPVNGSTYDIWNFNTYGETDWGNNISAPGTKYAGSTGSEMAYMYYNNLMNIGPPYPGWGDPPNTGIFINLQANEYWSETVSPGHPQYSFMFKFYSGYQYVSSQGTALYAWAVRDGDVAAVPIPGTVWLLGSGLVGLVGIRWKFKK